MLPLNINRKAYMGSPMTLSHLTSSDLVRSNSRSLIFSKLKSLKEAANVVPTAAVKQRAKVLGPLVKHDSILGLGLAST